jgi:hypothetical protein
MNDTHPAFQLFGRHVLGICISYRSRAPEETQSLFSVYSGFFAKNEEEYFFITAGHVIDEMRSYFTRDDLIYESAVITDNISTSKFNNAPIPISLKDSICLSHVNDDAGIDIGFIHIRNIYSNLLIKNSITPIVEDKCKFYENDFFDGLFLVGMPAQYTVLHLSQNNFGTFSPAIVPIPPNDPFSGHIHLDENLCLHARTKYTGDLKELKGMSGGPIFGIKRGTPDKYWLVAIQYSAKKTPGQGFEISGFSSTLAFKLLESFPPWNKEHWLPLIKKDT